MALNRKCLAKYFALLAIDYVPYYCIACCSL